VKGNRLRWAALLLVVGCSRGAADDPAALGKRFDLHWAASDAPASLADAPAPGVADMPVTWQAAVADLKPTSGFTLDGDWVGTASGSFETPVALTGGPVRVTVRAKGIRVVGEEWPVLRISLDGRVIGSVTLAESAADREATEQFTSPRARWIDASVETSAPAGTALLRVVYDCTALDPVERTGIRGVFFDRVLLRQAPAAAQRCPAQAPGPPPRRLLLIGLDGLSWSVVLPMVNRGELPHLAGLMQAGAYGPLDSIPPTYSPVIWSSIHTGVGPAGHGLTQMSMKATGSYTSESHATTSLKAATLWQMAAAGGRSSVAVGMYTSWPAQPVRGVIVSDRTFRSPVEGGVWPPDQALPVADALAELQKDPLPAGLPDRLEDSLRRDRNAVRLLRAYLAGGQPDLAAIYLGTPDHAGHMYYEDHAPFGLDHRFTERGPRNPGESDPVESAYAFVDRLVGDLLKSVDLAQTAVVVVSDHSCDMADEATRVRYKLDDLVRKATGGRAYVPFDESWIVAQIYLNIRGREPEGMIDPAGGAAAAEEIRGILAGLRTDAGQPVFETVGAHAAIAAAAGEYQPADLTGIVNARLTAQESVRLPDGASLPVRPMLHDQAFRSGTHDRFGSIIVSGAGARAGALIHSATILDVVPTSLALLGLPAAADLPGRPIAEAMADGIASPCVIGSWTPLARKAAAAAAGAAKLSDEELEKLRALGYVN